MKAHSIKTDNANVSKKVSLRKQATSHLENLRVLDLFAGNNVLWSEFNCDRYYGIEKERGKGKNLTADNMRVIASLDLSNFNVIDADSYGIPFNQISELFKNRTLAEGTVIVYTCITNKMSSLNKNCLNHFGLRRMYKKCKTLLNAKAHELFYAYLYDNGVREIFKYTEITSFRKDYGYFIVPNRRLQRF